MFPAVHDMPAPRADTPLTPDQVKQATDALTSERDHLNTQIQANGQPGTTASVAACGAAKAALVDATCRRSGRRHADRWCRPQAVIKV